MTAFTLPADPLVFTVSLKPTTFSTGAVLSADPLAFHAALSNAALIPQVVLEKTPLIFHATLGAVTMTYIARSNLIVAAEISDAPYVTVLTSVRPLTGT